jgi:hypothetical protein
LQSAADPSADLSKRVKRVEENSRLVAHVEAACGPTIITLSAGNCKESLSSHCIVLEFQGSVRGYPETEKRI